MAKGFGSTAVPAQVRPRTKQIASPQFQEISDQFFSHFSELKDPRVERTREHKLIDIIAIAILAVIGGAPGWEADLVWREEEKRRSAYNYNY